MFSLAGIAIKYAIENQNRKILAMAKEAETKEELIIYLEKLLEK